MNNTSSAVQLPKRKSTTIFEYLLHIYKISVNLHFR